MKGAVPTGWGRPTAYEPMLSSRPSEPGRMALLTSK
jgi:hypothetical protein